MAGTRRILFLCTGNACRSQMAEGLLRRLAPGRYESFSAGSDPAGYIHPLAVQVMGEAGVDISAQSSKGLEEFLPPEGSPPDVVVILCDHARRKCPAFPAGAGKIHWPVLDPIVAEGNEEIQLSVFRGVRDQIRSLIEEALRSGLFDHPPESFPDPRRRPILGRLLARAGSFLRARFSGSR